MVVKKTIEMIIVRIFFIVIFVVWGWWVVANSSQADINTAQSTISIPHTLNSSRYIAQPFTTDQSNLKEVTVFLSLERTAAGSETVNMYLRPMQEGAELAAQSSLTITPGFSGWLRFIFPAVADSRGKTYAAYFTSSHEADDLKIYSNFLDTSPETSMVVNDYALPYDLALIIYSRINLDNFLADWQGFLRSLLFLALVLIGITILGSLLLLIIGYRFEQGFLSGLCYALGCGLVFPGGLLYVASLVHLKLNLLWITGIMVVLCVMAGVRLYFWLRPKKKAQRWHPSFVISKDEIVLLALTLFILIQRLVLLRGVETPIWLDGLNHQKMITDFSIAGFIPWDLNYPQGFHAIVDVLNLFTGNPSPYATQLAGVLVNVLSGVTLYAFVKRLLNKPWVAVSAVLVYWLVAPFPTFLLNWSRFPLMLGMVLLAVAVVLLMDRGKVPLILPIVVSTGIAVAHYGAFLMWLGLLVILILYALVKFKERKKDLFFYFSLLSVPFVFLLYRVIALFISGEAGTMAAQNAAFLQKDDLMFLFQVIIKPGGIFLLLTSIAGAVLGIRKHRQLTLVAFLWIVVELILYATQILILGVAVSNITNIIILASIPLVVLSGLFLEWIITDSKVLIKIGFLALIAIVGIYFQLGLLTPKTSIFSDADMDAMQWIRQHTKSDDVFWVGSMMWGEERIPADGGGWIPYYANRQIVFEEDCNISFEDFSKDIRLDYFYFGGGTPGCYDRAVWDTFNQCPTAYQNGKIIVKEFCASQE